MSYMKEVQLNLLVISYMSIQNQSIAIHRMKSILSESI